MSLSAVRPYFRTALDSLGFSEWTDGFNFENIPQTILDKSYHLSVGTIAGNAANQLDHRFDYPTIVRVFFKGFRDPAEAIDEAILEAQNILDEVLDPSNRLGTAIKDVVPGTIDVLAQDGSNDNDVILEMEFTAVIDCDFT